MMKSCACRQVDVKRASTVHACKRANRVGSNERECISLHIHIIFKSKNLVRGATIFLSLLVFSGCTINVYKNKPICITEPKQNIQP